MTAAERQDLIGAGLAAYMGVAPIMERIEEYAADEGIEVTDDDVMDIFSAVLRELGK